MTRSAILSVVSVLAVVILVTSAPVVHAAGYVESDNFIVVAPAEPTQQAGRIFAQRLAERAEVFRQQIALTWLGSPLPDGVGRTVVNVEFTEDDDVGLTWAKDNPRRSLHNVYLKTNRARGLGSTLAHEVVHVVLATQFPSPQRLAPWVEEGIASQYDDDERKSERRRMLQWFTRTGNWPELGRILQSRSIASNDRKSYAVAASVAEMLIERHGPTAFVRFARDARKTGWDSALRDHYQIHGVAELARLWRNQMADQAGQQAAQLAKN